MKNEPIVIGESGMYRMLLHNKWIAREAPKRGLRDPWEHRPDKPLREEEIVFTIEGKEIKGTKTVYPEVDDEVMREWKAERDEYMRQRDEWIATQIFHKYGYDAFLAESARLSEKFRKSVFPCESQNDPQCSMFCPIFNSCAIKEEERR